MPSFCNPDDNLYSCDDLCYGCQEKIYNKMEATEFMEELVDQLCGKTAFNLERIEYVMEILADYFEVSVRNCDLKIKECNSTEMKEIPRLVPITLETLEVKRIA